MRPMANQQVLRLDVSGVEETMRLSEEAVFVESKFGGNDHLFNWLGEKEFVRIWQSIQRHCLFHYLGRIGVSDPCRGIL